MAYSNLGVWYQVISSFKLMNISSWTIEEVEMLSPIERKVHIDLIKERIRDIIQKRKAIAAAKGRS